MTPTQLSSKQQIRYAKRHAWLPIAPALTTQKLAAAGTARPAHIAANHSSVAARHRLTARENASG
jgi:hypothetical protein